MRVRESQDIRESHSKVSIAVLVTEKIFIPRDMSQFTIKMSKSTIFSSGLKKKRTDNEKKGKFVAMRK